jgi:hypothetical protein
MKKKILQVIVADVSNRRVKESVPVLKENEQQVNKVVMSTTSIIDINKDKQVSAIETLKTDPRILQFGELTCLMIQPTGMFDCTICGRILVESNLAEVNRHVLQGAQ